MDLHKVLDEYRRMHHPHARIDSTEVATTIGFLTALSLPSNPLAQQTAAQKEYGKAARMLIRCQRLLAVIEKYERV